MHQADCPMHMNPTHIAMNDIVLNQCRASRGLASSQRNQLHIGARSLKPNFSWKSLHVLLHSIYDSIHKQYFLTHAIIYIYDIYDNITQYLRYFPSIDKSVQSKQDSKILNQLKSATPPRLESQHKWCYQKVLPLTLVFSFIA